MKKRKKVKKMEEKEREEGKVEGFERWELNRFLQRPKREIKGRQARLNKIEELSPNGVGKMNSEQARQRKVNFWWRANEQTTFGGDRTRWTPSPLELLSLWETGQRYLESRKLELRTWLMIWWLGDGENRVSRPLLGRQSCRWDATSASSCISIISANVWCLLPGSIDEKTNNTHKKSAKESHM